MRRNCVFELVTVGTVGVWKWSRLRQAKLLEWLTTTIKHAQFLCIWKHMQSTHRSSW